MSTKFSCVSWKCLNMTAYSTIAIEIRKSTSTCAVLLSLINAGGMFLSFIAIENAFLDLMFAFSESESPPFSPYSLPD